WNTSNVESFSTMFAFSGVTSLDISSWDTENATSQSSMFQDAHRLSKLKLGEHFGFETNARLVNVPNDAEFTGFWQNVGSGADYDPQGSHVLTSAQLMAQYDGATMADTWVWQRR
ncbi:MAG: BspA family leucine-rich repeat surface protein, partial [Oscillospiraceae bacterium]|nr:BspA family leucine-rich repeat surface protein [Oscillospiraceae bacterium]